MHADPDAVLFVREKIDIVIPAADRAELGAGQLFQVTDRFQLPRRIVEQIVIDACLALASDTKRNIAHYVVHDLLHLGAISSRFASVKIARLPQAISNPTPLSEILSL